MGSWLLTDILPKVLPASQVLCRKTLWTWDSRSVILIEKGLCFIGKQAKGLSLAFLRPAMQTATCQEEMPSARQVQQFTLEHRVERPWWAVSSCLGQDLPLLCIKERILRFGRVLTSLGYESASGLLGPFSIVEKQLRGLSDHPGLG